MHAGFEYEKLLRVARSPLGRLLVQKCGYRDPLAFSQIKMRKQGIRAMCAIVVLFITTMVMVLYTSVGQEVHIAIHALATSALLSLLWFVGNALYHKREYKLMYYEWRDIMTMVLYLEHEHELEYCMRIGALNELETVLESFRRELRAELILRPVNEDEYRQNGQNGTIITTFNLATERIDLYCKAERIRMRHELKSRDRSKDR